MDVRCEKCQTEYELDESRLKPGGVTVKCTNCGHMFKIRKRANTNVGLPAQQEPTPKPQLTKGSGATKPGMKPAAAPQTQPRFGTTPSAGTGLTSDPDVSSSGIMDASSERQWTVRTESGETKTCKELATLQQWIVAGVVSREALISRSGKTWKRLGDVNELAQYFVIADEAKAARAKGKDPGATMLGFSGGAKSAQEDELERRRTGHFVARTPAPGPIPTAPAAAPSSGATRANPMAQTDLAPPSAQMPVAAPLGRATAAWANAEVKPTDSMASMPQGPRAGRISAGPEEPGFAGRVRIEPSDGSAFEGRVALPDDDDAMYSGARGSRAGMWITLGALLVIGMAAGAIYMFVFRDKGQKVAIAPRDAAIDTMAPADASSIVITPIDAGVEVAVDLAQSARGELVAGVHSRMKAALDSLAGKDDPVSLALRARLATALAQGMIDRAAFADKPETDALRKESKQVVIDAAPLAQRALAGQADSASANLAMADVMRLQSKPAPSVSRYVQAARAKAAGDKDVLASAAIADALLALRDGKPADAEKALASVEAPADDMRFKLASARVAYARNKPADAKAQVDQILAVQPDHDAALAMFKKLETQVSGGDPLPPEDGSGSSSGPSKPPKDDKGGGTDLGGSYDQLIARANKLAEQNCTKAMDVYAKALELKSNGVDALTGMGYCHLDAKQYSSAFSKFRAALLVSEKYEPALGGIAETYQRQGNKEAAIGAWRKYLEYYPSSARAKKQLEMLGASSDGDKKPDDGPPPAPPPNGSNG